jgi:NAD+ diphosphatase
VEQREGAAPVLPAFEQLAPLADGAPHFLGSLGTEACFAAPLRPGAALPAPLRLAPARSLYGAVDEALFGVVGRALAVAEWDAMHRHCGRCATPTQLTPGERARRCPACAAVFYPRISPAVIVLVERGDEVLLARNAGFTGTWRSLLAGFVEAGESFEETAQREVREEVGIELGDLRYFGSQPWPFGRSLMVGFTAQYAGGELRPDGQEIVEAGWYRADALPPLPPRLSIARALLDDFVARKGQPPR